MLWCKNLSKVERRKNEKWIKKINKYHILLLVTMLSAVVLLLVLTTKKEGMHVDEYLTYGLANNEFNGFLLCSMGLKTGVLLQIMIHAINIGLIWLIIFIPCVLYLLTITKIAIMSATRYISPSYAICVILLMGLFDKIVSSLTERDWVKWFAGAMMVAILLNNGYKIYTWTELHTEAKECVENARKYGINNDCIYVFASSGFIYPAYQEFIQYQNITFIRGNDLELLYTDDYSGYDHVVMYFDEHVGQEKIDGILEKMIEMNPGLDGYEMLHKYSYNTAYYLD